MECKESNQTHERTNKITQSWRISGRHAHLCFIYSYISFLFIFCEIVYFWALKIKWHYIVDNLSAFRSCKTHNIRKWQFHCMPNGWIRIHSCVISNLFQLIHIFVYSSGIVGQSWSIVFSTRGYHVNIYDNDTDRLSQGLEAIRSKMLDLESKDALRGTLSAADAFKLLSPISNLQDCVKEARYIQVTLYSGYVIFRLRYNI